MKKICVYDDESHVGEKYAGMLRKLESIRTRFKVETIDSKDFEEELNRLKARQSKLSRGGRMDDETTIFDETSILVLDYDIWKAFKSILFLTGEEVAYHARCFSKCGLIIGLNQYPGNNVFDLNLKGHPDSYADLNLWSQQLNNSGLWSEKRDEFRPWCWPQLPHYLESFEKKIKEVEGHLNEPVCAFLGLEEIFPILPKLAKAFIGNDPTKTTFAQFVKRSGNGLRPKDRNEDPELVARIAVARVSKWMERIVLPGQDILIDAPHLVSRYPSLLLKSRANIDSWNMTTSLGEFKSLGLDHEKIEDFRFKKALWLSRLAWLWGKLANCQAIEEVAKPWEREATEFLFCEDSSSFYKKEDCTEFLAELDSPYTLRFIRRFKYVEYQPIANLMQQRVGKSV